MLPILARARPDILALQPYSSARMEARHASIMLNANEAPWAPVGNPDSALNRYPDPQPPALRARLAEIYGVASAQLLIGRGSDEAIDLLVRAFCREGCDAIAITPPTYGMYTVAAHTQGATVIEIPLLEGFHPDADALLARIDDCVKLIFICTPNNPTGTLVPLATLERLAVAVRERALVVVDEAYFEFARDAESATTLLAAHANIVVLRTLSKAFALAGARVGSLIAHAQIVALLRRVQAPYPLPIPCIDAALAALTETAVTTMRARIDIVLDERERLARTMMKSAQVLTVYPSVTNFLCARFVDAEKIYGQLLARGIVVRDVSHYMKLAGCLRITIGTPAENDAVLAALDDLSTVSPQPSL
ncbi:MAG: histidinol-phosphate transaminase [Rhodanobacter sp.]|jgi:histidinol-phosphate aminotransferase|nr:histidinol-phosphate transaminase [Rhodanobacter sp.]